MKQTQSHIPTSMNVLQENHTHQEGIFHRYLELIFHIHFAHLAHFVFHPYPDLPVTLKGSLWSWGVGGRGRGGRGQKQRRCMGAQGIWAPCTLWLQVPSTDDIVQHTPFTTTPSENNFAKNSISRCFNFCFGLSGIKLNGLKQLGSVLGLDGWGRHVSSSVISWSKWMNCFTNQRDKLPSSRSILESLDFDFSKRYFDVFCKHLTWSRRSACGPSIRPWKCQGSTICPPLLWSLHAVDSLRRTWNPNFHAPWHPWDFQLPIHHPTSWKLLLSKHRLKLWTLWSHYATVSNSLENFHRCSVSKVEKSWQVTVNLSPKACTTIRKNHFQCDIAWDLQDDLPLGWSPPIEEFLVLPLIALVSPLKESHFGFALCISSSVAPTRPPPPSRPSVLRDTLQRAPGVCVGLRCGARCWKVLPQQDLPIPGSVHRAKPTPPPDRRSAKATQEAPLEQKQFEPPSCAMQNPTCPPRSPPPGRGRTAAPEPPAPARSRARFLRFHPTRWGSPNDALRATPKTRRSPANRKSVWKELPSISRSSKEGLDQQPRIACFPSIRPRNNSRFQRNSHLSHLSLQLEFSYRWHSIINKNSKTVAMLEFLSEVVGNLQVLHDLRFHFEDVKSVSMRSNHCYVSATGYIATRREKAPKKVFPSFPVFPSFRCFCLSLTSGNTNRWEPTANVRPHPRRRSRCPENSETSWRAK